MKEKVTYPNIDMEMTGLKLKRLISNAGYAVKDIQNHLHLSCPQPIYRWYKGQILPSVDNLFMLSELLNVHMEELLVKKTTEVIIYDVVHFNKERSFIRCMEYYEKLHRKIA